MREKAPETSARDETDPLPTLPIRVALSGLVVQLSHLFLGTNTWAVRRRDMLAERHGVICICEAVHRGVGT